MHEKGLEELGEGSDHTLYLSRAVDKFEIPVVEGFGDDAMT